MFRTLVGGLALVLSSMASATIVYTGQASFPGNATDLSGMAPAFGGNRLSLGSDLFYDAATDSYWGNTDRGPGGGVVDFAPRVHNFRLEIAPDGRVSGYTLLKTVVFKKNGAPMTGLNPRLAPQADASVLGSSFDPEGLVVGRDGHFFVSDEYGPSIYEFDAQGNFLRAFKTPQNLLPHDAKGGLNFVDGRASIVSGRQDNRGFEGLAMSKDGSTLYAVLQDPLVNEGSDRSSDGGKADGRRSRNVRIVSYSVATGEPAAQFIYQLEALADINSRLPADQQLGGSAQGRSVGLSAIAALDNGKFLVLERDGGGLGADDPNGKSRSGSKRVYLIDLAGATDVRNVSLQNRNDLPAGVTPVGKTLWLDIQAELTKAGVPVTEKMEGISFGPALDGGRAFVVATDNDFSVTQTGEGVQFNVCTSGPGGVTSQVGLDEPCPQGQWLIPSYVYVFKVSADELKAAGGVAPRN